jgi:ketosteroid isomerase-like protein
VANAASEVTEAAWRAMKRGDVDGLVAAYADQFVYDDRRQMRSDPITDSLSLRRAAQQMLDHYRDVEWRTLAVRGDSLHLAWVRWWNADGFETVYLHISEIGIDGRIVYDARFDDDDFDSAYRELEQRFYAAMGPLFVDHGRAGTELIVAVNAGELDRMFDDFVRPDLVLKNRSRSLMPDRSAAEFRTSVEELNKMLSYSRSWNSVLWCLSPNISVARQEREAIGRDGERFSWSRLLVSEVRNGKFVSFCEFDLEDEEAALGYAQELSRADSARLRLANRASEVTATLMAAMNAADVDSAVRCLSDQITYDDRRRLSGDPVTGVEDMRNAIARILQQYNHFESRTLAVRGERLHLFRNTWMNDAGYEVTYHQLEEVDSDGRIVFEARFDDDDFETAYRELEHRFYRAEGAPFAEGGLTTSKTVLAMARNDFDALSDGLLAPELTFENRSRSPFPGRTAGGLLDRLAELHSMVVATKMWISAIEWLTPNWGVLRLERESTGNDGELYSWTRVIAAEQRGGACVHFCEFDLDDEQAAFEYAEQRAASTHSRVAVTNRSCGVAHAITAALRAHDLDAVMRCCRDDMVYDDRRMLSGEPIRGNGEFRAAWQRVLQQYNSFDMRILAVRGDNLSLNRTRWSDDAGNESVYLHVLEVGDDGRLSYSGRFDDDDFESAYRELERRYYADHAEFAAVGDSMTDTLMAYNDGDFDGWWASLNNPDLRFENRSRSVFPDRSGDDLRESLDELAKMVFSARAWYSVIHWFTPNMCLCRYERDAVGNDGEQYSWARIFVGEFSDGQAQRVCQFDIDDEGAAFAYAEERLRASTSRLAVTNAAAATAASAYAALRERDVDGVIDAYADDFVSEDRRRLGGNAVDDKDALRSAMDTLVQQYSHNEWRILAVRGDRLTLVWTRAWADDGYETTHLHLHEVGDDGRIRYEARFDADDFLTAYRALDERYYAGEGADFRDAGRVLEEFGDALNRGDFDRAFGDLLASDFRAETRSSSAFADRSAAELRRSSEDLAAMVPGARGWSATITWLTPTVAISRFEREGAGSDSEQYAWTHVHVYEVSDGRLRHMCLFDLEAEDAAFAYAEDLAQRTRSRLAVTNRSCTVVRSIVEAMRAHDIDATVAHYSSQFIYDDHRRLSGGPVRGRMELHAAFTRIAQQYTGSEWRILAVRGDRLSLHESRWFDDAGNETAYLHIFEISEDGLVVCECRFDIDNFEGAYRELSRRYFLGEGRPYAAMERLDVDYIIAFNAGDFDTALGELSAPDFRIENRSRSPFAARTLADFRASAEELNSMVATARLWNAAVSWISPTSGVMRQQREAVGFDGEKYAWTRLYAWEVRDGKLAHICQFEVDDEAAAFAYAEERMRARRATTSRLALTNSASRRYDAMARAAQARDVEAMIGCYADGFEYDDRRRTGGNPIDDLRTACEQILAQYSRFEGMSLAVRGDRLYLGQSRLSDGAGNETTYLVLLEVDDAERIIYHGRFDADDFDAAYQALEARYYAGEGLAFAAAGEAFAKYAAAVSVGELDRAFAEFVAPDFRIQNHSRSPMPNRTATEFQRSIAEFDAMVQSKREWEPAARWLSPSWCMARFERDAVGRDGEKYEWARIVVKEFRDERFASAYEFDLDDEEAAFAYVESRLRETASRLAVTNLAKQTWDVMEEYGRSWNLDAVAELFSPSLVYDDRRRMTGLPMSDMRSALERIASDYSDVEMRSLAVRGNRLHLGWSRYVNDSTYESNSYWIHEVDDGGKIIYLCRFDDDDFDSAYRTLEERYYAGEGLAFAAAGRSATEWVTAVNQHNLDRVFGELSTSDLHFDVRSSSAFPSSSAVEGRAALEDFNASVRSSRTWLSAVCWVSPTCCATRFERQAIGKDGEQFEWTRLSINVFRNGRMAVVCDFDLDDEDAAFAYAERLARETASRLAVTNLARQTFDAGHVIDSGDVDAAVALYADGFEYDDHRRLGGNPIGDLRTAHERIRAQYNHFEGHTLAVRGDRLHLGRTHWTNDSGFETRYLILHEVDENGRIVYEGRFDDDDFDSAYRTLEERYYAGEGLAFAAAGARTTDWTIALNSGDIDEVFNELTAPEMHFDIRSRSAFPSRSASQLRDSLKELRSWVTDVRAWHSVVVWLSPNCCVVRNEREATGRDGEHYSWTMAYVTEWRDGKPIGSCEFELDDEDAAFAYAEEHVRETSSRLVVSNSACRVGEACLRALNAGDVQEFTAHYSDALVYDDRRQLAGNPFPGMREATVGVLQQYSRFEGRVLAVRGERLALAWTRWSNEAGFETTYLLVHELGDDGRFVYQGRFDDGDFVGAYQELNRRYCAGEGAAHALGNEAVTTYLNAYTNGDFDRVFGELTTADFRMENRSASAFGDRSIAELRAALEDLHATMTSVRTWDSVECWISPTCCVGRNERRGVGPDGEEFAWTRIYVGEVRDGRVARACEFDIDDEDAAFAYAEQRARETTSRLAVSNRASRAGEASMRSMNAGDAATFATLYADGFVFDDRRRLGGNPPRGMREAAEQALKQYTHFEGHALAVRGERLVLAWMRWSNDAGYETVNLVVQEVDDDDLFVYQGRFDEDDFVGAYAELNRRYCAGEGEPFADVAALGTEYLIGVNEGAFERVFNDLTDPAMRVENRSRSGFPSRSVAEFRSSFEQLQTMVGRFRCWNSAEHWLSPTCGVMRHEREATSADGDRYQWEFVVVFEAVDGRCTHMCEFDIEDEDAAFAYAEERMRRAPDPS